MSLSKLISLVAIAMFGVGFMAFPLFTFTLDGTRNESFPPIQVAAGKPILYVGVLLVVLALFIRGRGRGWTWIIAGLAGIGTMVTAGNQGMSAIAEAASHGFIGATFQDVLSGNTPVQTITNMGFANGFYVPVAGLALLTASGVWDILQQRGQPAVKAAVGSAPSQAAIPPVSTPAMAGEPAEKLKQLKEMLDKGLISQQDYDSKKADIIAQL